MAPTPTHDARAEEHERAVAQAKQAAAGLSRRELDVIAAAAEGLTTEEIASRLYISASAVKTPAQRPGPGGRAQPGAPRGPRRTRRPVGAKGARNRPLRL